MNILFFEPYCINTHHFGTCLELMIEHLKRGDKVFFIGCDAELSTCDVNISHDLSICSICMGRKNLGIRKISTYGNLKSFSLSDFITREERKELVCNYHFNNVEELKSFSFEDFFDIGYGVASSLISAYRDPFPDTELFSGLINQFIYSSKLVYTAIGNAIKKIQPNQVYVYNGRFAIVRPAFRVCQKYNVDVYLHESGSDLSKYHLTKNTLLHDISTTQQAIINFWNESKESDEIKTTKAQEFYLLRRDGLSKNWYSFTKDHVFELPEVWDTNKYNVVIFTSSEDEFAAIGGDWKNPLYKTQDEGIKKIVEALKEEKNIKVWVRLHPNLKTASEKLLGPYTEIDSPVLSLIMPDSTISSYLLMEKADKIVTFGSTMGIESSYWGKTSILLGMSFYKGLGCVYEAKSHEEAISLILDRHLKPIESIASLQYGFYMDNFGISYKYFKKTGIFTGTIDGWDFNVPKKKRTLVKRIYNKVANLLHQ